MHAVFKLNEGNTYLYNSQLLMDRMRVRLRGDSRHGPLIIKKNLNLVSQSASEATRQTPLACLLARLLPRCLTEIVPGSMETSYYDAVDMMLDQQSPSFAMLRPPEL